VGTNSLVLDSVDSLVSPYLKPACFS